MSIIWNFRAAITALMGGAKAAEVAPAEARTATRAPLEDELKMMAAGTEMRARRPIGVAGKRLREGNRARVLFSNHDDFVAGDEVRVVREEQNIGGVARVVVGEIGGGKRAFFYEGMLEPIPDGAEGGGPLRVEWRVGQGVLLAAAKGNDEAFGWTAGVRGIVIGGFETDEDREIEEEERTVVVVREDGATRAFAPKDLHACDWNELVVVEDGGADAGAPEAPLGWPERLEAAARTLGEYDEELFEATIGTLRVLAQDMLQSMEQQRQREREEHRQSEAYRNALHVEMSERMANAMVAELSVEEMERLNAAVRNALESGRDERLNKTGSA